MHYHIDVTHNSFLCVTWLIHVCDMTHSYVRLGSFICVTWLMTNAHDYISLVLVDLLPTDVFDNAWLMWHMTPSYVWRDSFMCVIPLTHTWDLAHAYVWHDSWLMPTSDWYWWTHYPLIYLIMHHLIDITQDSFTCVTWLIHVCDSTHSYVWLGSCICVTWLIHMCDMTHASCIHQTGIGGLITCYKQSRCLCHIGNPKGAKTALYSAKTATLFYPNNHVFHPKSVTFYQKSQVYYHLWPTINNLNASVTSAIQKVPKQPYALPKEPLYSTQTTMYSIQKALYLIKRATYIIIYHHSERIQMPLSRQPSKRCQNSNILRQQSPYILPSKPCIPSKEPYILSKEPYILSKDPRNSSHITIYKQPRSLFSSATQKAPKPTPNKQANILPKTHVSVLE